LTGAKEKIRQKGLTRVELRRKKIGGTHIGNTKEGDRQYESGAVKPEGVPPPKTIAGEPCAQGQMGIPGAFQIKICIETSKRT